MTHPASFAARARRSTALTAGILALALPAMAQDAPDTTDTTVTLDAVTITAAPGTQTEGNMALVRTVPKIAE